MEGNDLALARTDEILSGRLNLRIELKKVGLTYFFQFNIRGSNIRFPVGTDAYAAVVGIFRIRPDAGLPGRVFFKRGRAFILRGKVV